MIDKEMGSLVLTLGVLIASVHILGYIFERLRQPRLVGEILAGVLLGPFVLGSFAPEISHTLFGVSSSHGNKIEIILGFLYWLGLIMLMFVSGSQTRHLLAKQNYRETAWLLGVGTPVPFFLILGLGLASFFPLEPLIGTSGNPMSVLLILAIAVAVTSIPVISRIFHDLNILHTKFASLILGAAVIEDIILWGILAIATAITQTGAISEEKIIGPVTAHILLTAIYMATALSAAPRFLKKIRQSRWNILIKASPLAYVVFTLFFYVALAAFLKVNLVFAAFLAGFGLVGGFKDTERKYFDDALTAISKFSFAVFIPIYFGMVGYKLVLGRDFSLIMLLIFLIGSSIIAIVSRGLAARLAGFRKMDILNLAITTNARGGPGIVLASVAYEAGIISAAFYTILVLTAILTSQVAGAWLRFILGKGWPLLASHPHETWSLKEKILIENVDLALKEN